MMIIGLKVCYIFFRLIYFLKLISRGGYFYYNSSLSPLWGSSLSYGNQSIDWQSKSMNWFLYDRDHRYERVNNFMALCFLWNFPFPWCTVSYEMSEKSNIRKTEWCISAIRPLRDSRTRVYYKITTLRSLWTLTSNRD